MAETGAAIKAEITKPVPERDQPGLSALREAVANAPEVGKAAAGKGNIRRDAVAGLNVAVTSVPDAMAEGLLAGVNPVYGLYAAMTGPLIGGIFSSSQLMVITTTSAAALAAGQSLDGLPAESRANSLFLLVIVAGVTQVIFGLLRLGRLTRFVSYSVMTGFLAGVSFLLILSQLPTITGVRPEGENTLFKAFNVFMNIGDAKTWPLGIAAVALLLAVFLPRTFIGRTGTLFAIALPSLFVAFYGAGRVPLVQDVGTFPSGIPWPEIPSFTHLLDVTTGGIAVALILLVQGAGVSQSVSNPNDEPVDNSRDFLAHGLANVVTGFFRGLPVGGSLGMTAVNVLAGATSRWAAIFAGIWMAAVVIIFPGIVSKIAMPALGALIVVAGVSSLKPKEVAAVFRAGWTSWVVGLATFIATLTLPIQLAVGLGVALSSLLYIVRSSTDISVVELVRREDGLIEESKPCKVLPSNKVTVLDVYGPLFYAGAHTLKSMLPSPRGSRNAAVVLRLRGENRVGATLMDVLFDYAEDLERAGGRLYLSGMSAGAYEQVSESGRFDMDGPVFAYEVTPVLGQSTRRAVEDANAWLLTSTSTRPITTRS